MPKNIHIQEQDIIAGNYENKYHSRNVISRYLINRFLETIFKMVDQVAPETIHEVGCGEGYLSILLNERGYKDIRATDFSGQIINEAKKNATASKAEITFGVKSVYELDDSYSAELVMACEVLEHLAEPQKSLEVFKKIASPYLLVSVPREPIWRILNMTRGKYLTSLGNTPGHIQAWSYSGFMRFLGNEFEIINTATPLPWIVILAKNTRR